MNIQESIKNKLLQLPKNPGVYTFYNNDNEIIYIGKAKNLKNRVKSYFQNKSSLSPKNATMLKHIVNVEWIIVRSEVEALMTEANLIKLHKPKYNIDLRHVNSLSRCTPKVFGSKLFFLCFHQLDLELLNSNAKALISDL